jgi:hypothetical protein
MLPALERTVWIGRHGTERVRRRNRNGVDDEIGRGCG